MTLYETLRDAGIEMNNHYSDLYVEITEKSTAILNGFPIQKRNSTRFKSLLTGKLCYDVPFAYLPFWESQCPKQAFIDTGGFSQKKRV